MNTPASRPFARARGALLALVASFGLAAQSQPSEPPTVAQIRAQLDAGEPARALETARLGLEYQPEDSAMFAIAIDAATADGKKDEAIHLASQALRLPSLTVAERASFEARLDALDPRPGARQALLDAYAERMLELAKAFERRKLYANAVDLLLRCAGTASADAADKLLDKVYGNAKAVEALLDSGVDVPVEPKKAKKRPEEIAKLDRKHRRWQDAYEVKSTNYTVRTNMGYELAHAVSTAMEQMGLFYRQVFGYKERGGTMRRCVLDLYADRLEFDEHEARFSPGPTVGGFFAIQENRVAIYDPRTVGRPYSDFWETLFHEASHQFTHAVSKTLLPSWLNEGTASYFEGARLTPNGRVETNLIPEGRLRNLYRAMGHGQGSRGREGVQLRDVIAYYQPGSYPGSYYAWGWGLVYFIHNFENERSERIYLEPYRAYWAAYAGAENHDVVDRFLEYFVRRPGDPDADTFEEFEHRFTVWIRELYEVHYGGPEQADTLVARGRRQQANGKHEYAVESYRWALRKRSHDLAAVYGLALSYAELERTDAALFHLRQAVELARREADPSAQVPHFDGLTVEALVEDAWARMARINEELSAGAAEAVTVLERDVIELANALAGDGYPLAALGLLDRSTKLVGETASIARTAAALREEHDVDMRRWRRQPVDPALELWTTLGDWKAEGWNVKAEATHDGLAFAYGPAEVGEAWRYEVDVAFDQAKAGTPCIVGLAYGVRADGSQQLVGLTSVGTVAKLELQSGEAPEAKPAGAFEWKPGETHHLALEVRGDELELFVDGESVLSETVTPVEVAGRLGYFHQGANARFANARILE